MHPGIGRMTIDAAAWRFILAFVLRESAATSPHAPCGQIAEQKVPLAVTAVAWSREMLQALWRICNGKKAVYSKVACWFRLFG
jgi:hypothetical protein